MVGAGGALGRAVLQKFLRCPLVHFHLEASVWLQSDSTLEKPSRASAASVIRDSFNIDRLLCQWRVFLFFSNSYFVHLIEQLFTTGSRHEVALHASDVLFTSSHSLVQKLRSKAGVLPSHTSYLCNIYCVFEECPRPFNTFQHLRFLFDSV